MFFSANEFHSYLRRFPQTSARIRQDVLRKPSFNYSNFPEAVPPTPMTKKETALALRKIKDAIVARQSEIGQYYIGKWLRPWGVVPALANFRPPQGDYGVGVEVEYGFTSPGAASTAATFVRNWRYVTLDREGGQYPLETTFAPILYSKLTLKSQPFRYLKFLNDNASRLLVQHNSRFVGTHINVSAHERLDSVRVSRTNSWLTSLSLQQKTKYFGRDPYGYIYHRNRYVEMKLFNSTTDRKALRRYINIAVSLVKLMESTAQITQENVLAALENGYNGTV